MGCHQGKEKEVEEETGEETEKVKEEGKQEDRERPKTALLVVDMQKFFAPMGTELLLNVMTLITHFKAHSAPIIFTQHGHSEYELATVPSPSQLVRRWGPDGSIAYGSEDWELLDTMKEFLDATGSEEWPKTVEKNTYDAFLNTDLDQTLQDAKIQRVVVCGVTTDSCWWEPRLPLVWWHRARELPS